MGGPAQQKCNPGIGYPNPACQEELQKRHIAQRRTQHTSTHTHTAIRANLPQHSKGVGLTVSYCILIWGQESSFLVEKTKVVAFDT